MTASYAGMQETAGRGRRSMVAAIKVGNREIAGITHMHMDYAYINNIINPASSNLLRQKCGRGTPSTCPTLRMRFADAHRNLGTYMFNNYIYIYLYFLFTKGDDIINHNDYHNDNHIYICVILHI